MWSFIGGWRARDLGDVDGGLEGRGESEEVIPTAGLQNYVRFRGLFFFKKI